MAPTSIGLCPLCAETVSLPDAELCRLCADDLGVLREDDFDAATILPERPRQFHCDPCDCGGVCEGCYP